MQQKSLWSDNQNWHNKHVPSLPLTEHSYILFSNKEKETALDGSGGLIQNGWNQ